MWALVPHYGAECEETLIFTDEYAAMTFWRGLHYKECVSVVRLYEDPVSGAWIFSLNSKRHLKSPDTGTVEHRDGLRDDSSDRPV